MGKKVVYLQKQGTLESFCVFEGDILCENPSVTPISEKEHKELIAKRNALAEKNRVARIGGYKNAEEKEADEARKAAEAKEAKAVAAKKAKEAKPAKAAKEPAKKEAKEPKKGKKKSK